MKNKCSQVLLISTMLLMSCNKEDLVEPNTNSEIKIGQMEHSDDSGINAPIVSSNQLVVRYKDNTLDEEAKIAIRTTYEMQYHFNILDIETCHCQINDLELWTIDTSVSGYMGIEDLVKGLQNNSGEDDMDGDFQFSFQILSDSIFGSNSSRLEDKIVPQNNEEAINIAVIDTGVDYDYFPEPFLYNSAESSTCEGELSGWDFVNNDSDARDDRGHGTFITKIITDKLNSLGVAYQILPVKAFDHQGRGSYWNVVCALRYILDKPDIDLVNMSFGWGQLADQVIMEDLFQDLDSRTLLIASAGNEGVNTDLSGNEHFPSGYDSNNLLTVAGYSHLESSMPFLDGSGNIDGIFIAPYSNYGRYNIDLAAPFEHDIRLESDYSRIDVSVKGTSYSCAQAIVRGSQILFNGRMTPSALKNAVMSSAYTSSTLRGKVGDGRALSGSFNTTNPGPVLGGN